MPSRRSYLAGVVTAGVSGLAGCAGLSGPPQVAISKIKGINLDTEPHTLAITLSETGTPIYQSAHELAAASEQTDGGTIVIEQELPDTPGQYELEAVLDDSVTERADLAAEFDGSRLRIIVDIDQQSTLSFFFNQTPL